jgi:hypothetical protein
MEPEMVRARTRDAAESARVISPETVSRLRSPSTCSASMEPEITFAVVGRPGRGA